MKVRAKVDCSVGDHYRYAGDEFEVEADYKLTPGVLEKVEPDKPAETGKAADNKKAAEK